MGTSNFQIDPDISKAKTIATDFYTNPQHFHDSREKIFTPSWHFAGDTGKLIEPDSAYPFTLLENYLDEPLLITRDRDGQLHCMSNVCTHRGNLLVSEPCKLTQLTCRYHGRRFSLKGEFISMPEFKEVKNFPTPADNLHKLPLYQWGTLLFTSLAPFAPAEAIFGDIQKRLSWFPMDELRFFPELSNEYTVKANWALYCENYLEGFHIPFVHAGLNAVLDFGKYTTELFRYSNLQVGFAKEGEACFEPPAGATDHGKKIAAYYFWAFPNLMLNFYPWGVSINEVQPVSVSETRVRFYTYVSDAGKLNTGAGNELDAVEHEDEEVVENVQKGVRSRFYNHGRYSVTREQGTHHFHSLIAEFM
jgi:choline monooxygenase